MAANGHNTTATIDPYDSAMSAEARPLGPRNYFGQITTDVWHCVLEKGAGKVPFDPGIHAQDQRCTAIDLTFTPISRDDRQSLRPMQFSMIAESKEWASIVKPSLIAISSDLRSIRDRWVQIQLAPTGRTYTNKQGEVKDANTVKFIAVYASEAECRAASEAFFSQHRTAPTNGHTAAAPSVEDAGRTTAAKFLPALWRASGNSVQRFEQLIKQTEPCNKYFDLSSPEVLSVISA